MTSGPIDIDELNDDIVDVRGNVVDVVEVEATATLVDVD